MAVFRYEAVTTGGREMTGTLEARDADQVRELLAEMELEVNAVTAAAAERPKSRIGRHEFILFNRQIESITRAGIPLAEGLRQLARDTASKRMRRLIEDLAADLESGTDVAEALEKREKSFPPLYSHIIRAGVQSGRLPEMLASLNRHLEVAGQTRRVVMEAVTYPLVVLVLASIVLTGGMLYVVPSFEAIIRDLAGSQTTGDFFEVSMPAATAAVFWISHNIFNIWIAVGGLIVLSVALFKLLGRSSGGRAATESLYRGIPVLGRVYHRSQLCRLADAMAVLVSAGCDLPTCLRLGAGATGSETLRRDCETLAETVESGQDVLSAGQFSAALPPMFLYSVQLGVQRNDLADGLYALAETYAEQTRLHRARLQGLLLPVMLVIVGGFVAFMIAALMLPFASLLHTMTAW